MQQFHNQVISELSAHLTPSAHECLILPAACVLIQTPLLALTHFLRSRNHCLSTPSHMSSENKMIQTILKARYIICLYIYIYLYSPVTRYIISLHGKWTKGPHISNSWYEFCYE